MKTLHSFLEMIVAVFDNLLNYGYDKSLILNVNRIMFAMNAKPVRNLFLRCLRKYEKAFMLLSVITLLLPGLMPHGFLDSNKTAKSNRVAHVELCCCGNIASKCRDCCCSDDHTGNDNSDRNTITITACGGISDNIIIISTLNYLSPLSSFAKYISVTTMAETATLQFNDALRRQPYKPPKLQLLSNHT